ncbi:MAG TPA: 4Fe-4S dicluster domain-containing protein, partial [Dissulfurispiraceae bacterium]|nr:4Fe-4S dicluster domain-containing protein [Dissulfurispiraceae bacterium]
MAKNPNQIGWYYNENNCIACRACEAGCKQEFDLPIGVRRRRVIIKEEGTYPNVKVRYISAACNHCEEPACLKACPVGAYTKEPEFGVVLHDQKKCIGCKRCMAACPYGAPQFDAAKKKVDKCSLCYHRLKEGLPPACVRTCMGYALWHGKLSDIEAQKTPPEAYRRPLA